MATALLAGWGAVSSLQDYLVLLNLTCLQEGFLRVGTLFTDTAGHVFSGSVLQSKIIVQEHRMFELFRSAGCCT